MQNLKELERRHLSGEFSLSEMDIAMRRTAFPNCRIEFNLPENQTLPDAT